MGQHQHRLVNQDVKETAVVARIVFPALLSINAMSVIVQM
jgi:hypothetical protein